MTIAVLHKPFDESFSRQSIPALKAAGYTDAIRYIIGAGKAITLAEYQAFTAAGMSVAFVDEGGAQMGLSGYAGGITRATAANQALDALGIPRSPERAIYYATEDPTRRPGTYRNDADFFRGIQVIHAQYGNGRIGAYGSGAMVDYVMSRLSFVSLAWNPRSWGVSARANLIQEVNPTMSTLGGSVDQNTAVTGDWGQHPSPAPPIVIPTVLIPTTTIVSSLIDSEEGPMQTQRIEIPVSKGCGAMEIPTIPWGSVVAVDKEGSDPNVDGFYLGGSVQRQQRNGNLFVTVVGATKGDPDHPVLLGTDAAPAIAAVYVTVKS